MHGPRKENGNIYLLYENGDDCGNGKNYSSRIQMECGDHEVRKGSYFDIFVFASEDKGKVWIQAKWPISAGAYPGFL